MKKSLAQLPKEKQDDLAENRRSGREGTTHELNCTTEKNHNR
jgi:hypothetical protein